MKIRGDVASYEQGSVVIELPASDVMVDFASLFAELWGAICPDCGPQDYEVMTKLIIEHEKQLRDDNQMLGEKLDAAYKELADGKN